MIPPLSYILDPQVFSGCIGTDIEQVLNETKPVILC